MHWTENSRKQGRNLHFPFAGGLHNCYMWAAGAFMAYSSAVEHPAVNRIVAGSNPVAPVRTESTFMQ